MSVEWIALAIFVAQLSFFAGVFWSSTRKEFARIRKNEDGLGEKGRQTELKLFYVALMLAPDEKRQEILNALVRKLT